MSGIYGRAVYSTGATTITAPIDDGGNFDVVARQDGRIVGAELLHPIFTTPLRCTFPQPIDVKKDTIVHVLSVRVGNATVEAQS
ncbi:MAG: hypothetical protein MUF33_02120 [Candidatus Nanopelagicales bacterium]|jgi:hypothetical protein|nr:hypothetical protein [Candidatus Nanopelagicales bacterium]